MPDFALPWVSVRMQLPWDFFTQGSKSQTVSGTLLKNKHALLASEAAKSRCQPYSLDFNNINNLQCAKWQDVLCMLL